MPAELKGRGTSDAILPGHRCGGRAVGTHAAPRPRMTIDAAATRAKREAPRSVWFRGTATRGPRRAACGGCRVACLTYSPGVVRIEPCTGASWMPRVGSPHVPISMGRGMIQDGTARGRQGSWPCSWHCSIGHDASPEGCFREKTISTARPERLTKASPTSRDRRSRRRRSPTMPLGRASTQPVEIRSPGETSWGRDRIFPSTDDGKGR